ncbi:family 2 glycosyl transferase [Clostridium omnivorum]|uniref:Family 2 glycosyl transferase n=1 Tax=Clostridium omnivorum TaxID=1604902 RepID=A0ABQ5N0W8_9CLOT|nr:family 2 glycosyl transferase [Clostridium sp. E14]GLC28838.1 hypothetical protein bsdE14_02480 [Clostridium sp. E14]
MKRYFMVIILIVAIAFSYFKLTPIIRDKTSIHKDNVKYVCMVDDKYFYVNKYGKWEKEFIKGVNIGAGKPGTFPGELAITKEEYLRWFKYIGELNANTIRVYTILKPEFYNALYEYNKKNIKPIYVMQGVWINEDDIANTNDAFNPKIMDRFKQDIKTTIDIIHGNAVLAPEKGHASGVYSKDVSQYFTAWILGIEWDPDFVIGTNEKNKGKTSFQGKYLFAKGASPFETWLSEVGDYTIDYETARYGMQRPLSFTNWVTTDVLKHPNEPLEREDKVSVNTEKIQKEAAFKPGLFASYHIYPYYPDFMNYQSNYKNFTDENGNINTYKAYLKDLRKEYNMPVLVAEFGIPASRGMAHVNIHSGYNQGNIDEKTQGEMCKNMLQDIYDEGYAGGLVFTWQDEWFKRTWNTMDFDIADRRPYWSNPQTNEQEFGLLAFDPGSKKSISYVDGNIDEWKKIKPVVQDDNLKMYVQSDEKYLYLLAQCKNFDKDKENLIIPIDITDGSGNIQWKEKNISFDKPADFLVVIDGEKKSRVLVDAYYDSFYYMYSKLNMIEKNQSFENKNNGIFNPIYLCLNRELFLPQDKIKLPLSKYETGKLVYGDGNPEHKNYNSLADFIINGDNIEIRIPWALLNVMDPSTKMVIGDMYKVGIMPIKTNGISIGLLALKGNTLERGTRMANYSWKEWEQPTYHERLKPSYYIIQKAFKDIEVK